MQVLTYLAVVSLGLDESEWEPFGEILHKAPMREGLGTALSSDMLWAESPQPVNDHSLLKTACSTPDGSTRQEIARVEWQYVGMMSSGKIQVDRWDRSNQEGRMVSPTPERYRRNEEGQRMSI